MSKKVIMIVMCAIVLVFTASCGSDVPEIDGYTWEMHSVQAGSDGRYIACSPSFSDGNPDAVVLELECKADNGKLTLKNLSDDKSYEGTYRILSSDIKSNTYEIVFGEVTGYAVCAMTEYHDGSEKPTFIINIDEKAINFFPEENG